MTSRLRARASKVKLPAWALCTLALVAWSAAGQGTALEGREVRRIEFQAPAGTDLSRVREAVRTREGDPYRAESVRADVAAIYAIGEFADVAVEALPDDGGVRLIFRITARPILRAIRFEGNLFFDEATLRGLLQSKIGSPISAFRLRADKEALRSHFRNEGFIFADVRQTTRDVEGGVEAVYAIESGPRVSLESIRFEGLASVEEDVLRRAMTSVKEAGLFSRGKYDPALLRSDLLAAREALRRRGYLDATVGHDIIYDEGYERAYLLVRVREGPLYRVRQVIIRGAQVLSAADLEAAMKLRQGEPFSQEQLDADLEAIRNLYGRIGYIKAAVSVERTFAESQPLVTLTLSIQEGRQYTVNKVIIRHNQRTQDHVIRRDVTLIPGEIASTAELEESKRRLLNTGLFFSRDPTGAEEPVRIRFAESGLPDRADVIVEVTEGGVGDLSVGAGISSSVGLVGHLRLTYRNFDAGDFPKSWRDFVRGDAFVGGGQRLTLSLTPGVDYQDYRLSWLNPSVADSPYSLGFDLYSREYNWPQYYDDERIGASVSVGRKFMKDLEITLTPRVERVKISNLDDEAPDDAVQAKGTHQRHSLALGAAYDRRDNIFLTTRGYRLGASVELAGTVLGGDVDFLREELEARQWWTVWDQAGWGKHVVNIGGEVGFLQKIGSRSVPIFDRYFIGGIGSLRGFRYRRVGPTDSATNKQVGGEFKLTISGEYEAPLVRDTLRGVLFLDTGTVEESVSDIGHFRAAAGGGIRLRLPFLGMQRVPLSLYFAWPLAKEPHDKEEIFSFTIGTGFEF